MTGAAELKCFSILLAWNEDDHEAGAYGWSGLATDFDSAIRAAQESAVNPDDDDDQEMPSDIVLDSMEGCNMWAAPKLLEALKAVRRELDHMSGSWTEGMANFAQMADQAIAEAEGRTDA